MSCGYVSHGRASRPSRRWRRGPRSYPGAVLELPRSVRLAAWGTAALAGAVPIPAAVAAVTGDDEPHGVELATPERGLSETRPDGVPGPDGLAGLLVAWRAAGVTGLRVVLPVPGDVLGLPGPAAFNRLALQAEECVLTAAPPGGPAWGAVPVVTEFGSRWEPGRQVTWAVQAVTPRPATDGGTLAEAERALREALAEATHVLDRLDVASWRDDAGARIAGLRQGEGLPAGALPPSAPARSVRVLGTALNLRAIVALATEDDGGAVTGYAATARRDALRSLDTASRRATAAAANALLEPRR